MTAASPVYVAVNPNNSAQRYILWGNGFIEPRGGAPSSSYTPLWYDRLDQPVGVALWIINWTTGAGYILDFQGGFQPLNGAPAITQVGGGAGATTNTNGLPYEPTRMYVDWSWDPAQNGQGYALTAYGELRPFGGAVAPPRTGPRWTSPAARKLQMQWGTTKRAVTLDLHGGIQTDFGATFNGQGPYWPTADIARDFKVTNWTNPVQGYVLDLNGAAQPFGGAPSSLFGGPFQPGGDNARTLWVLSAANPLKFWQVWAGGQEFEYIASGPPTVVAGGVANSPAATVTTTTTPTLAWSYSDPDQDAQAKYQVLLFTQAYVTANTMTDPLAKQAGALEFFEGTDPTVRGVVPTKDLLNGTYRFYVRAQDAAGQWSAWANLGWTQNVPVPNTPSALGVTPDSNSLVMNLTVATTGTVAQYVRFDYTDDGGTTWFPVRGAGRVPRASTTSAVDRDVPLGKMRGYRAMQYAETPRTASAWSASVFAQTSTSRLIYILTSTVDSSLGGEVFVKDAPSWDQDADAGVFSGDGAYFSTVVSDVMPLKARTQTITIETDSEGAWLNIKALLQKGGTLVYRDPFGDVAYCRVVGTVSRTQRRKLPYPNEVTPLRHNHLVKIPFIEVAPPL
jgi:hypothetical protein